MVLKVTKRLHPRRKKGQESRTWDYKKMFKVGETCTNFQMIETKVIERKRLKL